VVVGSGVVDSGEVGLEGEGDLEREGDLEKVDSGEVDSD